MMGTAGKSSRARSIDAKRVFDVMATSLGLLLSAPLMAAIAVAIRAGGDGPALFRQQRVGRGGVLFRIRKFRTMRSDLPGALVSPTGDPRITGVGAVLRRSKLDELPQLLDVLQGRMSLVGPRPEVPAYVALWPEDKRRVILSVRPGITDPATVLLRYEAEQLAAAVDPEAFYREYLLPRKVEMYVHYVENRSFSGDLRILFSTVRALVERTAEERPAGIHMP